jgi:hypothetical protein
MVSEQIKFGNQLLRDKKVDEAERHFKAMIENDSRNSAAFRGLIRVGRARRDLKKLLHLLDAFVEIFPNFLAERANLFHLKADRGDTLGARNEIPKLLRLAKRKGVDEDGGRRLLTLIQLVSVGSERVIQILTLRDLVLAATIKDPAKTPRLASLLAALHLSLEDYEAFSEAVLAMDLPNLKQPTLLQQRLGKIQAQFASPDFPDFSQPKVFGIGLSRTGTTSLHSALTALGYNSLHWVNDITGNLIHSPDYPLFDAFSDISVSHQFEWLYHSFPNSKFVLTWRNPDSWVKSISRHYRDAHDIGSPRELMDREDRSKFDYKSAAVSMNLYGQHRDWRSAFESYHDRVDAFFKDKPQHRFLKLKITEGEGYNELCPFLGLEIKRHAFPDRNPGRT